MQRRVEGKRPTGKEVFIWMELGWVGLVEEHGIFKDGHPLRPY